MKFWMVSPDNGDSEDWNPFYQPIIKADTEAEAKAKYIADLKASNEYDADEDIAGLVGELGACEMRVVE
jgi:hypothetical protein